MSARQLHGQALRHPEERKDIHVVKRPRRQVLRAAL